MGQNVAQLILKALAHWGVKNIYGVSGDAILPLMDALGKQSDIRFISTANEQGASLMACGEARLTGKPGICLATEGPGAINLLNGVADAYGDGVPLLVITGQVETSKLSTNTKQYFQQQQLFSPVTGLTALLTRPESTVETFKTAMEKAVGDSTACHISVPKDIFLSPAGECHIPDLGYPSPPNISGNLEEALKAIAHCHKPIVITGKAAVPYKEAVFRLAVNIGAGIIPAQGARGIYPDSENIMLGGLGEAHIPPPLGQSDCVLVIGSSPYEHKFIPPQLKVVQIDTRPQNIAQHLRPIDLTGDINLILTELLTGLSGKTPDNNWLNEIKEHHHSRLEMIRGETGISGKPIPPRKIVAVLNDILPEDAVIAIDSGEFMHWFDRGFISKGQSIISSDYWRCMGSGLPYGLGAQMASPNKKVIVLTGDGSFVMTMQELVTAVRYALPVVVIIFNNGQYLLEKHRMEQEELNPFGVDFKAPDFAALARSCGADGIRLEDTERIKDVLLDAMGTGSPVVIDIPVSDEKPLFI